MNQNPIGESEQNFQSKLSPAAQNTSYTQDEALAIECEDEMDIVFAAAAA